MPSSEIRRQFVRLVVGVVVLDAVAIALYYAIHVPTRPTRVQQIYMLVWTAATLAVVMPPLGRIRALRRGRSR